LSDDRVVVLDTVLNNVQRCHTTDDPQRQIEQRAEAVIERGIAVDLAAYVANDAAEPGAQDFERSPGGLEPMGMGFSALAMASTFPLTHIDMRLVA
jgi:hypothetical protein